MKTILLSFALLPLTILGCASANQQYLPEPSVELAKQTGNILIYRTNSLQASLAKAYIGIDDRYFSKLDQNQYVEFKIDPGFYTFKARANGSVASKSKIKVMPGETLCIEARPNHEELEWIAVPFVNAVIPSFVLKETSCPTSEELSKLSAL